MQWNVTDAVYLHEFDVSAEEINPRGVCFKPDGTKMYIIGTAGDAVVEYDLGTQWDVSTAVYLHEFSIAVKETSPTGFYFKPDGTKMYTIGYSGNTVDEYDLGTQWDVSSAVFLQEFSVAAKEIEPMGVCFKPDGTKMYTIGDAGNTVDEYDLGVQWDVSTAVYLQEFDVSGEEIFPQDMCLKPDGTKMYIVGYDGDAVVEYDLGVQWDVSTAVYLREISVVVEEGSPRGLCFKPDGTKMYVVGIVGVAVDEYDLL